MQNIVESMEMGAAAGAFIAGPPRITAPSQVLETVYASSYFLQERITYILFETFQYLDLDSLLKCRLVCSNFRNKIDSSSKLQYKIELAVAGQQDGSYGNMLTRRKMLERHQMTWNTLVWTAMLRVPMTHNRWRFNGGVFAQVGAVPYTLRLIRIPSDSRGIIEKHWLLDLSTLFGVGGRIENFGMDPSQDLLYVVKIYCIHDLEVHLLTLSGGERHPLSSGPFRIPPNLDSSGAPQWSCIKNFHEFIAVHSAKDIVVWNWKTGKQLTHFVKYGVMSMAFLNERYILLGVMEENKTYLLVFDFLAQIEGRLTPQNPVIDFVFELPENSDPSLINGIFIHTNPRMTWGADTNPSVPFSMIPQNRLFTIYLSFNISDKDLCFAILEESFISFINDGLRDDNNSFEWSEWGPEHSRAFIVPSGSHFWSSPSHGTRFALAIHLPYQGTLLRVLDFNQLKIRKRNQGSNVETPGLINTWMVQGIPVSVLGPNRIAASNLYDHIDTSLGYRMISRFVREGLQVASCGEDAIVMADMTNKIFEIYIV